MAFIAGLVLNMPGVWYLDALVGIAKSNLSNPAVLVQILVFNVIMFTLVELPIVSYLINPTRTAEHVNNVSDWAHHHSRTIGVVVATAVGIWLLTKGIDDLAK